MTLFYIPENLWRPAHYLICLCVRVLDSVLFQDTLIAK
jgi:hypothetical protein